MRSFTGKPGENGLVQAYTGTAYEVVKFVHDNMDVIAANAGAMDLSSDYLFFRFVATAGQTVFTGMDANGRPLKALGAAPFVYVNRTRLAMSAVTVESDNTVVRLSAPVAAGSVVLIAAFAFNADGTLYYDERMGGEGGLQLLLQVIAARDAANTAKTAALGSQSASAANAAAVEAARAQVESLYEQFDDRYLGPKPVHPTLDNDDGPLIVGTMYWSTSVHALFVWSGTQWNQTTTETIGAVTSFAGRVGDVMLLPSDVLTALGYTPLNMAGGTVSGDITLNGNMSQTGNRTQTGSHTQTGDLTLTGSMTVSGSFVQGYSTNLNGYSHEIYGDSIGSSGELLKRFSADSLGPTIVLQKSRGSSATSYLKVLAGDALGSLLFQGADGTTNRTIAQIRGAADADATSTTAPGRIIFSTTGPTQNTPTERLRIGSTGQLGFGGANYGVAGQIITSGGPNAAPVWADAPKPTGAANGGGSDKIFFQNDQVVTTTYAIPSGQNAMTAGPVSINNNVTVTIPAGSVWTIV